ncbi:MAG: hypothetical protein V1811_03040 [Candidatus Micrarchaeota archaeon]
MKKIILLLMLAVFSASTIVGPLHPTEWSPVGNPNNIGSTPNQSIDNNVGDTATWWRFTSDNGEGANFVLNTNGSPILKSVTISAISTGHKTFVIKRNDGTFDEVYSLGTLSPAGFSSGTAYGSKYLQPDGSIIIGVRNAGNAFIHYLNDIAITYETQPAVPSPTQQPGFRANYWPATQTANATLGELVNFTVMVTGTGKGNCNYTLLPQEQTGALRINADFENATGWIAWQCDFTTETYTIEFQMPAIELNESAWKQDEAKQSTNEKQFIYRTQTIRNPSSIDYANASGNYSCHPGFSCNQTGFSFGLLQAASEHDAAITAEGDAIYERSSQAQDEVMANFTSALLLAMKNVRVKTSVPDAEQYALFLIEGKTFVDKTSDLAYAFTYASDTARWTLPEIASNETELYLLYAKEGTPSTIPAGSGGTSFMLSEDGNQSNTPPGAFKPGLDFNIPNFFEAGLQEINVFDNGEPANGDVQFIDPEGNVFVRKLNNGNADFLFDKEGEWKIKYGNSEKTVIVTSDNTQTPKTISLKPPSTATGLVALETPPEWLALLFLIAIALAILAYTQFYAVLSVSKSFANGKVKLVVINRKSDLKNCVLLDVAPEAKASSFSEKPEERETLSGTVLKWKKMLFPKGAKWIVEYSLAVEENMVLRHAELHAETKDGKPITTTS